MVGSRGRVNADLVAAGEAKSALIDVGASEAVALPSSRTAADVAAEGVDARKEPQGGLVPAAVGAGSGAVVWLEAAGQAGSRLRALTEPRTAIDFE